MKLPSLQYLTQNAGRSFLRFPLTIITSFIAVCIGIYLTEFYDDIKNIFPFINVMLCAALGIPLFFCVDVFAYNKGYSQSKRLLLHSFAFVILVVLYFTLPDAESTQNTSLPYVRYSIYAITIHLVVAFIPFLDKGQLNGFWHYNKILFVRFLTSMLYSAFLYGGLALALGSLDFLFDIDLHSELFMDLFILIAGLFNTWFFVSGIPATFHQLDEIEEYPRGIKIFSQFVLLPLLILYLVILYIYASKIVVLWSWPKGIVSYLIACVAVLGILTLLLIHPYGNLSGNTWIKKFSRLYYFILIPLVALLFIAIGMRVADYGITINRYVILLLGVWLTIVCFYFIAGRVNIKFIPISLAVILVLASFGFWGMFSVSERSQVARLEAIVTQHKILQDGKVRQEVMWQTDSLPALYPEKEENVNELLLSDSLHNEVKSILDYLDTHHGFTSIRPWFIQDIDSLVKSSNTAKERWSRTNEAEAYMRSMGLKYEYRYTSPTSTGFFSYSSENENNIVTDVRDYDYIVRFRTGEYENVPVSFNLESTTYSIHHSDWAHGKLLFVTDRTDTILFNTDELIDKLISKYGRVYSAEIPQSQMLLQGSNDKLNVKLELHVISLYPEKDSLKVNTMSGDILIRKK
jgi:hypothetical protein